MEKIINISGKDVKFKATAGTLTRYRMNFKRDLLKDLFDLNDAMSKKKNNEIEQLSSVNLEVFERIAWALAKTADESVLPIERWLDDFEIFSIYQILPEILELVTSSFGGITPKKTIAPLEVVQEN